MDHVILCNGKYADKPYFLEEDNLHIALSDLASADAEFCAAVLTYHGIPDTVHPWCNTPQKMFIRHMDILRDSGCRVMNMKECRRLLKRTDVKGTSG